MADENKKNSMLDGLSEERKAEIENMSYEEARDKLAQIVQSLDQGGQTLESSTKAWQYGVALAQHAQALLQKVAEQLAAVEESQRAAGESAGTQDNLANF